MENTFYNSRLNRYSQEVILSTKNGRIALYTMEDAMVYGHTQGLYFLKYRNEKRLADYALRLAEMMKEQNRNKLAARCYRYALYYAWHEEYRNTFDRDQNNQRELTTSSEEIYNTARYHLFNMGDHRGLKRLKGYYAKLQRYMALEAEYTIISRICDRRSAIRDLCENRPL